MTILLVPDATTPAQYGGLFIGFLISVGCAVVGIAMFTASYIVKAVSKAVLDMGGHQAQKVFRLPEPEELDRRFSAISTDSIQRSKAIVDTLTLMQENLTALTGATNLLRQELNLQVARGNDLRENLKDDIEQLQNVVFKRT